MSTPTSSTTSTPPGTPVLSVDQLNVEFWVDGVWYPAVVDASFDLNNGEVLAIVGESGSGKSTTALATLALARAPVGRA